METRSARFLTGSTLRHVVVMSLTGSVGLGFMFLVDVVTLYWVSAMGDPVNVAGIGLAAAIQFFNMSFGIGFAIAGTAVVSRALGRRERAEARRLAASALVFTGGLMCLVAGLVVGFRGSLIGLIGSEEASMAVARDFLLIAVPSLPLISVGMGCAAILRAEGDALRAMLVTVTAGSLAMVLDPLLIFGLGMGVEGAAWAMVLSRGSTALLGLWFLVGGQDLLARPTRADLHRHAPAFFGIAGPAVLTQLSTPAGNLLLTGVIAGFGDAAVAAWAVAGRLTILAFGGIFALSGAIGGIIGQNFGAGQLDRVRAAYRDALLFCLVYVMLLWAVLAASTGWLVWLFQVPREGVTVLRAFTHFGAGAFVFTGALFVSNAAFNNLGRPFWPTGFNWLRDGVLIWPLAVLLAGWGGAAGVVWAQGLAGILAGTLACLTGWHLVRRGLTPASAPTPLSDVAAMPH